MEKYMENFKLIECPDQPYKLFLILLFCHSKVNQRQMIVERLNDMQARSLLII